jgi:hypothetical protein
LKLPSNEPRLEFLIFALDLDLAMIVLGALRELELMAGFQSYHRLRPLPASPSSSPFCYLFSRKISTMLSCSRAIDTIDVERC